MLLFSDIPLSPSFPFCHTLLYQLLKRLDIYILQHLLHLFPLHSVNEFLLTLFSFLFSAILPRILRYQIPFLYLRCTATLFQLNSLAFFPYSFKSSMNNRWLTLASLFCSWYLIPVSLNI